MNRDISQANVQATICNPNWSTKSIRPPASYTNALKKQQLADARFQDKTPAHYGKITSSLLNSAGILAIRRISGRRCGAPDQPVTARGPFPPHLVGTKSKDAVENQLHREVCAGTLTLDEARHIITTHWFKYYRDRVLK